MSEMDMVTRFSKRFQIECTIQRINELLAEGKLTKEEKKRMKKALKDLKREGEKLYE